MVDFANFHKRNKQNPYNAVADTEQGRALCDAWNEGNFTGQQDELQAVVTFLESYPRAGVIPSLKRIIEYLLINRHHNRPDAPGKGDSR